MNERDIDKLSTEFSTPISIKEGKKEGWRVRAKLAVRGLPGSPQIGLFKPGTHDVEDLVDCPDHNEAINKALRVIRDHSFVPYNETTLSGDLRYVQLTVSRQTKTVQLVLVSNGMGKCDNLAKELEKAHPWHSIWINVQEGSTNTIFGKKWIHKSGPKYLEEELLGLPFYFHPACFIQAHLDLYEEILRDIRLLAGEGFITELYAGVGAISRTLDRPANLVEYNPYAHESFKVADPPPYLEFITGKSEDHTDLFRDILIVDPPRKGLDPKILKAIADSSLKQILYLSCNPESLKRDVEALGWKLDQAIGYHLFPNTDHIELLFSLRK